MAYIEKKRTKLFALPIYFTKYTISEEKLNIKRGLFTIQEDDTYMYKIQDVRLTRTLGERIFGTGTVICYTGDITHPELTLFHIKHASEIKDYIISTSEESRRKRRVLHNLDIDVPVD